jgi:hypothetical protein
MMHKFETCHYQASKSAPMGLLAPARWNTDWHGVVRKGRVELLLGNSLVQLSRLGSKSVRRKMNRTLASVADSCVVASPQGSGQEVVAKARPV